jgi:hypothetical protein
MRSAPPRRDSVGRRASLAIVGAPSAPAVPAFAAPAAPALDEATIARHTVAAREFYNARRRRHKHLPADLFGEPTWDILLDLYVAGRENRRVPTTSACIGAHVPPTTALRWLRILEARGLVEREDDGREGPAAREVGEWLHEIGLLRTGPGGVKPDERHLCHSPQERLFLDGAWQDGLLPSAEGRPATLAQYRAFGAKVAALQAQLGFAMPSSAIRWTAGHAALDAQTFAAWLAAQGLGDERLLAHLDYACRDDYGAGIATVSAWAGIHYFASRHGFHAPGDESAERDAVFTWHEGNAFLVRALAAPLQPRLHAGQSVLRVTEGRHEVQVLVWNEVAAQPEAWTARAVVMATPLFITQRLLQAQDAGLASAVQQAAGATRYAPWLVANLQLAGPLLERVGAPPAWDNVRHVPAGSATSLGYVNARHQATRPDALAGGPQLITVYHALPESQRPRLLAGSAADWTAEVLADLAPLHPDIAQQLQQADLVRWGHAMAIPAPGVRGQPARAALRAARGRVRFAHADLAGYSVFEEAFTLGCQAVDRDILGIRP